MTALTDLDLKNKRVLVRVDFNVPIDDNCRVGDDTRMRESLPTINYLREQGCAVILMSHLGRPKGSYNAKYSLAPVAKHLQTLLGEEVVFSPDCIGREAEQLASELKPGQVMLLENLRFYPMEENNDKEFAHKLARLADVYVNDAFGTAHRAHASTVGVTAFLPSCAGFLMEKEIANLSRITNNPEHPFVAIIGGAKVSDKYSVIENLLGKVDKLLIGGGMANTFLAAMGDIMQKSLVEHDKVALARIMMDMPLAKEKLVLPVDVVAADGFSNDAKMRAVPTYAIPDGWMALDIGPETVELFKKHLKDAKTIIWNGPLGVFEMDNFSHGTMEIAQAVADADAFSVIGGGDSLAAIGRCNAKNKISHLSTGGGASLDFLSGKILPGVAVLTAK